MGAGFCLVGGRVTALGRRPTVTGSPGPADGGCGGRRTRAPHGRRCSTRCRRSRSGRSPSIQRRLALGRHRRGQRVAGQLRGHRRLSLRRRGHFQGVGERSQPARRTRPSGLRSTPQVTPMLRPTTASSALPPVSLGRGARSGRPVDNPPYDQQVTDVAIVPGTNGNDVIAAIGWHGPATRRTTASTSRPIAARPSR